MGTKRVKIWKKIERKTYIKGSFVGKYRGNIDVTKSESNYEKYYDIEVYEGEIYDFEIEKNNPSKINEKKYTAFKSEYNFLQKRFENIKSKPLNQFTKDFDEFKLKIHYPKVKNIQISKVIKNGKQTFGTFNCIVFGYLVDIIEVEEEIEICTDCNFPIDDCSCLLPEIPSVNERLDIPHNVQFSEIDTSNDIKTENEGCLYAIKIIGWITFIIVGLLSFPITTIIILFFVLMVMGLYKYFNWQHKKLQLYNNGWSVFYKKELIKILKIIATIIILVIGIGYYNYVYYKHQENERIKKEEIKAVQKRFEAEQKRKELQVKKDKSQYYLDQANKNFDRKRYKQTIANLDSSLLIFPDNYKALFKKGMVLKRRKKYTQAIEVFNQLSNKTNQYKSEIYLEKGRCLLKLGKKEKAIVQIYQSAQLNNVEAKKIYERINPFIKEIIGYVTRCCDGTTSSATGRGACSHHGGVCNWNDPIYSKRRKYQVKF